VLAGFDRNGPADLDLRQLHDAAITIILRLVVLRIAGARGLLDRDALPKRGGPLFAADLPIDDLTRLQLLQILPKPLDVEQLGAIHESLLDHAVARSETTLLGLRGARGAEPDVPLEQLEQLASHPRLEAFGTSHPRPEPPPNLSLESPVPDALLTYLQALTGRSAAALTRDLRRARPGPTHASHDALLRACAGDEALCARITPWTALLRRDADGRPRIILAGRLHVIASGERRSTGSHYTPRALAESLVQHTLDPLCHIGPAEGMPRASWRLRPRADILALRICDLAMGCGAFLLAACRYLAAQLLASETESTDQFIVDPDERERQARRDVLACLHGVDRNPIAVELARLALWLDTASPGVPLDIPATLRVGDAPLDIPATLRVGDAPLDIPATLRVGDAPLDIPATLRVGDALLGIIDPHPLTSQLADTLTCAALRRPAGDLGQSPCGAPRRPLHWPLAFPPVFRRDPPGFDAIIGNPPFQGGQKLAGALGPDYRDYLIHTIAGGRRGSADLCAYFFLRAAALLRSPGMIGLLATSTIAQGDTREVGLDRLCADGLTIVRAAASAPWPGAARLAVAQVWLRRGPWAGERLLEDRAVPAISPALAPVHHLPPRPYRLRANADRSFIGSYVLGLGFVLTHAEAQALLARDPRNREVLSPYLGGDDLTRDVDHAPGRWIVNFRDWPLERAASYPDCLARVRELVKPQRDRVRFSPHARDHWWQYERPRVELYAAAARGRILLACARVAKYMHFVRIDPDLVASEQLVLVTTDCSSLQAVLESAAHEAWASQHASTLDTRRRYTPTDCLETFAMPVNTASLAALADRHDAHRRALMRSSGLGLTRTYNRVHDPAERDPALVVLRDLHVEIDRAVVDAYGWSDLKLGHDFHGTAEGRRFTIAAAARRELQERLLALNHARHAEEVS
jgi:hypothetical protein